MPTFLSNLSHFVRAVMVMTVTGGLLCLFLLCAKPFIRHRLPKTAQYVCWLVVLFSFWLPLSPFVTLPHGVPGIPPIHSAAAWFTAPTQGESTDTGPPITAVLNHATGENPGSSPSAALPPASSTAIPAAIFMWIYPPAALFVLAYHLLGYAGYMKKLRKGYTAPRPHELALLKELAGKGTVPKLFRSNVAATPMLVGILRPAIVLPNREYTPGQLHAIFLHELTHMKRQDIAIKWLAFLACVLHWFNPLAWLARKEIDRVLELACDETVIRHMDAPGRQSYGDTLIAVAGGRSIPLSVISTTMCAEKRVMKERLTAIMKNKKRGKLAVFLSLMLIVTMALTAYVVGAGRDHNADDDAANSHPFIVPMLVEDIRVFELENMTEQDRNAQMSAVTLYADGTAAITNALVISYTLSGRSSTTFSVEDNILTIYQHRPGRVPFIDNQVVAVFSMVDDNTLELLYAHAPLIGVAGTRYVFSPFELLFEYPASNHGPSIPYVGAAHETQRIVNALPLPRQDMSLRSIEIGRDHGGFGHGNYTLSIYYNLHAESLEDAPEVAFDHIAAQVFALIKNLKSISIFIVHEEAVDINNYVYLWKISRESSENGGDAMTFFGPTRPVAVSAVPAVPAAPAGDDGMFTGRR